MICRLLWSVSILLRIAAEYLLDALSERALLHHYPVQLRVCHALMIDQLFVFFHEGGGPSWLTSLNDWIDMVNL